MSSMTRKRPLSPTTSSTINSKPTSLAKKARTIPDIRILLSSNEHAFADFDLGHSMSGYGDSEEEFIKMDDVMLDIIAQSESQQNSADALSKSKSSTQPTPKAQTLKRRWDPSTDADVGEFKTGRTNKQQRGWITRQKAEWEKERMEQRRERRERDGADVLRVGLEQLREDRDWIAKFGLEGFFPRSIEKLENLVEV